jgi:predicted dehydrogenase
MKKISWGIIGCGNVTEQKSGPAFNKVPHSELVAVMRRDIVKAEDYAKRHGVPFFYNDAEALINHPGINAVYIATPPDSHESYAIKVIEAGKAVYLEKPMTIDYTAAKNVQAAVEKYDAKLCVAHYRNAQPFYLSLKEKIANGSIGFPQSVQLHFFRKPMDASELLQAGKAWRVDPRISGGGLFHDLAPHQLATLLQFFGNVKAVKGRSKSSSGRYAADDQVEATMVFENDIPFRGQWNFNADKDLDECIVTGSEGTLKFSFFSKQEWEMLVDGQPSITSFDPPLHVQEPMIKKVVEYFLDMAENPCPVQEGVEVMRLMDLMTSG